MKAYRLVLAGSVLLAAVTPLWSQNFAPPPAKTPDEATLKEINAKSDKLAALVASLRRQGVGDPMLADVETYHKAAAWIVRHQEFYQADAGQWTLEALDRGQVRAKQAAAAKAPWLQQTGDAVIRGYRSGVDGSVQPYAVTWPADYGKDLRKKWRLDVVLHGRDLGLTEVKFLHQHAGGRPAPKDQDYVRLDIYGRGNNAYRWAGETDVLEALEAFVAGERHLGRAPLLDPNRVVLRGFSMGGAGTWHLGLHLPSRWCVLGPGAGFTTTHGYVKDLPEKLPPYQEDCLRIYDAVDYAENAFNVPVVAYAGADDPQLAASRNIQQRLKPLKIAMTLLVAPGLGHSFPPEWQKKAEGEYARYAGPDKGRKEYPDRVRFVTYTLKYSTCAWVEILALDRHYEQARVDAEKTEDGFTVKTANVRALHLGLPEGTDRPLVVSIDDQELKTRPTLSRNGVLSIWLERRDGRWKAVLPQKLLTERFRKPQKMPGLQGPIDDAFTTSFLCVRGTGRPWHDATQSYAEEDLKRFRQEWDRYLRGDLPIKDDVDVTEDDIASHHLVLFGDPASNALIAQVLDGLPLRWTKESITFAGKSYAADEHIPVLVYPSPLNTGRYVVLNSGHTFHTADFQKTNAMLFPRLGDYALLKLVPTEKEPLAANVVRAGLFDDFWQIKKGE